MAKTLQSLPKFSKSFQHEIKQKRTKNLWFTYDKIEKKVKAFNL